MAVGSAIKRNAYNIALGRDSLNSALSSDMDASFVAAIVSKALGLRLRPAGTARGFLAAGGLDPGVARVVLVAVGFLRGRGSGNSITSSLASSDSSEDDSWSSCSSLSRSSSLDSARLRFELRAVHRE